MHGSIQNIIKTISKISLEVLTVMVMLLKSNPAYQKMSKKQQAEIVLKLDHMLDMKTSLEVSLLIANELKTALFPLEEVQTLNSSIGLSSKGLLYHLHTLITWIKNSTST